MTVLHFSDSPKAPPPHHDIGSPDPGYTEMGESLSKYVIAEHSVVRQ